jgi:DnaJ-domain-containing protein 1
MPPAKRGKVAMFDNAKNNNVRALVAITLRDGSVENLSVKLSLSSKLHESLNNADFFLDVVNGEGRQLFISKREIAKVELIEVPKVNQLNLQRRAGDKTVFDPYAVLGVERGADPATIRQAYHLMAKKYHPDRFLNVDLPKEMSDYAAAMLVRINLANEQIGG